MPNQPDWIAITIPVILSLGGIFANYVIYREKVNTLEKAMDKLASEVKELRDKTIACETSLKERANPYVQRNSPLSLTTEGKDLLRDSGGQTYIIQHFDFLYDQVEKKIPKTAYDVQELAQKVLEGRRNDDSFNPIKNYAFKEGLSLEVIIQVMAIFLRDKILLAKNWHVDDIDRHNPNPAIP